MSRVRKGLAWPSPLTGRRLRPFAALDRGRSETNRRVPSETGGDAARRFCFSCSFSLLVLTEEREASLSLDLSPSSFCPLFFLFDVVQRNPPCRHKARAISVKALALESTGAKERATNARLFFFRWRRSCLFFSTPSALRRPLFFFVLSLVERQRRSVRGQERKRKKRGAIRKTKKELLLERARSPLALFVSLYLVAVRFLFRNQRKKRNASKVSGKKGCKRDASN